MAPDHHWHETYLTVRDPAKFVVEVTGRHLGGLAKFAVTHFTVTTTVECHGTTVPAAGDVETTLVHFPLSELGVVT